MRDVRLFLRDDRREPVGKGLHAVPAHAREYNPSLSPDIGSLRDARRSHPFRRSGAAGSGDGCRSSPATAAPSCCARCAPLLDEARRQAARGETRVGRGAPRGAGRGAAGRGSSRKTRPRWSGVINATGVVVHTNLGRAPLSAAGRRARRGDRQLELEPRVRPRAGRARPARGARRGAPALAARRRGHGRGEQLRRRRAAGRQHLRRGPRGAREPRRAGRDRRLVPHPRDPREGRRAPARGRHDEQDARWPTIARRSRPRPAWS